MRRSVIFAGLLIVSGGACLMEEDTQSAEEGEVRGVHFHDREVWVTSQHDGVEKILDENGDVTATIALPGAGPHITTFSPSNRFGYIGGMLDGKLYVLDARNRSVVTSLQVGPTLAHQAKPSPDGRTLLVSVISGQSVVKVSANEQTRQWSVVGSASTAQFGKPPICSVFRNDGQRAYVSLNPSGLAVLDVNTMTFLSEIPTDGFIACGMIKTSNGSRATIAASGGGGHIYDLDLNNGNLTDRGTLGAGSWHSFIMTSDGRLGFGTSPLTDEVIVIDLSRPTARRTRNILIQPIAGTGNNQPDAVGGGELLATSSLAVSLRAAGKVAFIDVFSQTIEGFTDISAPSPFNPATCQDCAVHGITVRRE